MNRRDLGKLAQELGDDLTKTIDDLKVEIANAKRLKTSLEKYFQQATEVAEKITNEETGLQALLDSAAVLEGDVNTAKTNADTQLQKITDALTAVQSNIKEMESAYESFAVINQKITNEETGLQASLNEVSEIKMDIVAVKTNADTLYKEIRKFRDDAANYLKEIGGLKQSASVAVEKIEAEHTKSTDLRIKIEEIFSIGTRGVHANHFVKRRNQLFWISVFWLVLFLVFLVATIKLAEAYIMPLADALKNPTAKIALEAFLLRFSIITPTLFGSLYALKQFSNDRRLYEKYAFKAISTYTTETSVDTLIRSTQGLVHDDRDGKIIDFAVNTLTSLYQEPVEPIRDKWVFRAGNKLLDLTAETNQSIGDIKEDIDKLAKKVADN